MDSVKFTPEETRSIAGHLQEHSDTIVDIIERVRLICEELRCSWEGAASDAYATAIEDGSQNAMRVPEILNGMHDKLMEIAANYEIVEDANINLAKSLSTDIF